MFFVVKVVYVKKYLNVKIVYELEVYDVIFENVNNNMIYYIRNVLIL